MNISLRQVDPDDAGARRLIAELDRDLNRRYPGSLVHGIDVDEFKSAGGYFVLLSAGERGVAVACAAFRPVTADCVEIKRVFVEEAFRGRGYARTILRHLEEVAKQRGFRGMVLETGVRQPEAIALYQSAGYFRIPNFAAYAGNPNSVCFAKPA
jgi:GNAT superfamily N-acetyltransferase